MAQLQQKQYQEPLYENGVHSKDCIKSTESIKLLGINKTIGNKSPSEMVILHEQQVKPKCGWKDLKQNQSVS